MEEWREGGGEKGRKIGAGHGRVELQGRGDGGLGVEKVGGKRSGTGGNGGGQGEHGSGGWRRQGERRFLRGQCGKRLA